MHSLSDNVKIVAVLHQFSLPLQHAIKMMRRLSKHEEQGKMPQKPAWRRLKYREGGKEPLL